MFGSQQQQSKKSGRQPSETKKLTDTLAVNIWQSNDGSTTFHWDMARLGRNGTVYATKRIETLLEVPLFVARLSEAFANSSAIDTKLRHNLAELAAGLHQMLEVLQTSKNDSANGEDTNGGAAGSLFKS